MILQVATQVATQDARTFPVRRGFALILIGVIAMLGGCGWSHDSTNLPLGAQLTSIDVGPPNSNVPLGLVSHFTATGIYTDGSKRDISMLVAWRSMNTAVAYIGSGGMATTVNPGTTTILASLGGTVGSTSLTVTPAVLVSIGVTPANPSIANGLTEQFSATGVYSDNTAHDLTGAVTWSSTNAAVAAVSQAVGTTEPVTALTPGSTTITASLGGVSGSTMLTVTAATLVSIGVTPMNSTVAKGLTTALKANGIYTDNSIHDLTAAVSWGSSDSTVAAVSNTSGSAGLASALAPGSTTVTATLNGVSGSTMLTVSAATLVSIGITPTNPSLAKGLNIQFTAMGTYTDNSTQNLTATAVWSSSDASIASVSNAPNFEGYATALNTGTVTITATMGTIPGSTSLTVTSATLVSIAVTPVNPSIANGLSTQLTATGTYTDNSTQNLTTAVAWTSSAPAVASVGNASGSQGIAMAMTPGSTTIAAAIGAISGSTVLSVTPATLVSIAVTPPNPSVANGLSAQFIATGTYTDNSTQNLTTVVAWTSSVPSVANISNAAGSSGLATALGIGATTIAAASAGVSGSTSLTITAATLVSIALTPANPSIANGTTQQLTATGTYTDNSTQNLTAVVSWGSSNPGVASVSNAMGSNGLVTSLSQGFTNIGATFGSISAATTVTITPATLVTLTVIPSNPSIANGTQQQFSATGTYTDHSTQDLTSSVTWGSSDSSIASLSNASGSNGLASTLTTGSVTVTAVLGSVSGSTGLTVTPATLVSIAVIPANPSIANGTSQQFAATGTYTDSSTQPLTAAVTWSSSDMTVATISNATNSNGLASTVAQGAIIITATLGSVSGSTGLSVTPATLVSIAVTPAGTSIPGHTNQQFTATGTYTDASTQNLTTAVTWTSSATSVAMISNAAGSNGLAAGGAVGQTSISAALGAIASPAVTLTVTAAPLYAFVANQNDNTVSSFSIGPGGALSLIGSVPAGNEPNAVAVDPTGRYVYAANWTDGTISEYAVGSDGSLTGIGTVAAGTQPASLTIDTTGQYVYSANLASNTVSEYAIGMGGVLTPLGSVAAAGSPISIVADPAGNYLYVADQSGNSVSEYSIGTGGVLTPIGTAATGNNPQSMTVDPSGRYAYVANGNDATVSAYSVNGDGTLTPTGTIPTGNYPETVAVDPSGRYVYVENYLSNTVSEYSIGTAGALSTIGTAPTGNNPWFITIDPTGSDVYVVNFSDSTVSEYTIGAGGILTNFGTVPTGSGPNAITTGY
jgi:trimeric autotransporter adhesin